ncbi:MAG: hypothetical protein ACOH2P_09245 [Pseudomonas sp.]
MDSLFANDKSIVAIPLSNYIGRYIMTTVHRNPSVQPGTPDPAFGDQGTLTLHDLIKDPEFALPRLLKGLSSVSQGKTIFSAQMYRNDLYVYVLGRLDGNGRLDTTFADRGFIAGNFVASQSSAGGKLAVQESESGKIYMLGWTERTDGWADLVVACFDKKGKPDLTFGESGRLIIETPPDLELQTDMSSVHVQPDNKLLISPSYLSLSVSRPATGVLLRLLPDGSPDSEFSNNGRWEFKLPGLPNASTAITACVSQGEKIVIAGYAQFKEQKNTAVLARLDANGQIDASFGDKARPGFHVVEVADRTTQFNTLIERSDGSLLGAGAASTAGKKETAGLLVAVTPNGTPHQLFNNRKPLITQFDEQRDNGWASALAQTDNRFVVASTGSWVYVARFQPDGQPDTGFNGKGFTNLDSESRSEPVVLTSGMEGRIIVSANTIGLGPEGVGLARCFYG